MFPGDLVDQRPAKPLELGVGQADGAADASLAQGGQPGRVGRVAGDPCFMSNAAISASGSGSNRTTWQRETIVSSCSSGDVPIRIKTAPAAAPRAFSRMRSRLLRSGRRRRRGWPPCGPRAGFSANWSHRSRITLIGSSCLSSGLAASMKSGCVPADLNAARAGPAGVELGVRARLAQKRLRQLAREGALADPLGADEQEGVREPPLPQAALRAIRRPDHGRGPSARTRSTSLLDSFETVSGSSDASIRTIGAG